MELVCECGKWFELSYSKRKQIISGIEIFCSTKCAADYLLTFKTDKYSNPLEKPYIQECVLSEPLEYWDKFTDRFYRSKSEAITANWFNAHGIDCLYECFVICIEGTSKVYNPDFYLPYHNVYIEVKGLWLGSSKKKVKCTNGMGLKVVVFPDYLIRIMERELREAKLF